VVVGGLLLLRRVGDDTCIAPDEETTEEELELEAPVSEDDMATLLKSTKLD